MMDVTTVALIMMAFLLVLLATGLEIAASIGIVAVIGLLMFTEQPLFNFTVQLWSVSNSFILTAIPLFIFMAEIFSQSGLGKKLFWAIDRWMGFLPGGIACTVIGASSIFAAITGSSVASAATMGSVAMDPMKERKYDMRLTFGVIASGGTLGILIPPSLVMILYGAFTGLSVGRLFAAGIISGFLLASIFLLLIIVSVKIKPSLAAKPQTYSWKEKFTSLKDLIPSFFLILTVLGGIFGGVVTPTEAAAAGCVGATLIALAYRMMSWKIIWMSAKSALRTVSMIMLVAVFARVLSFLMQYLGLGEMISGVIIDADLGKYGTLGLIFGMYLILGMFFEGLSMMILTLPFVMPIIYSFGLSGYWFVVPLVIMVEASLISPPVGLNLYVLQSLSPEHDVLDVALGALPFFIPMLIIVALVSVYPEIVTWLPGVLYG